MKIYRQVAFLVCLLLLAILTGCTGGTSGLLESPADPIQGGGSINPLCEVMALDVLGPEVLYRISTGGTFFPYAISSSEKQRQWAINARSKELANNVEKGSRAGENKEWYYGVAKTRYTYTHASLTVSEAEAMGLHSPGFANLDPNLILGDFKFVAEVTLQVEDAYLKNYQKREGGDILLIFDTASVTKIVECTVPLEIPSTTKQTDIPIQQNTLDAKERAMNVKNQKYVDNQKLLAEASIGDSPGVIWRKTMEILDRTPQHNSEKEWTITSMGGYRIVFYFDKNPYLPQTDDRLIFSDAKLTRIELYEDDVLVNEKL